MRRTLILSVVALCAMTGARAQDGVEVPFVTTPDHVTLAMLQLAGVTPRDRVIDLGSGDGRIVITAAKRFGASGLGVEIVPDLVARSREHAERAGVSKRARFAEQDLFKTDLGEATVITMYLLPEVNLQLRPRLLELKPGTRIVSHDWDMGDWRPDRTVTLAVPQKTVGREKLSRLHRWVVPARMGGVWCAGDGSSLTVKQQYQYIEAALVRRSETTDWGGRLDGALLRMVGPGPGRTLVAGAIDGDRLVLPSTEHGLPKAWARAAAGQTTCVAAARP